MNNNKINHKIAYARSDSSMALVAFVRSAIDVHRQPFYVVQSSLCLFILVIIMFMVFFIAFHFFGYNIAHLPVVRATFFSFSTFENRSIGPKEMAQPSQHSRLCKAKIVRICCLSTIIPIIVQHITELQLLYAVISCITSGIAFYIEEMI